MYAQEGAFEQKSRMFVGLLILLAKLMSLPVTVFLRRNFGVRWLTLPWILGAFAFLQVVAAYTTAAGVQQAKEWEAAGIPLLPEMPYTGDKTAIWSWIFLAGGVIRWLQTRHREWKGVHLHTFDRGEPNTRRRKISESKWVRFIEPLMVAFIGWTVYQHVDKPLGLWFYWTAGACFLFEHLIWLRQRHIIWDMTDPMLDQLVYSERAREMLRPSREEENPYIVRQPGRRRGWFR